MHQNSGHISGSAPHVPVGCWFALEEDEELESSPRCDEIGQRVRPKRHKFHKLGRDNASIVPTTFCGDWKSQNRIPGPTQFFVQCLTS